MSDLRCRSNQCYDYKVVWKNKHQYSLIATPLCVISNGKLANTEKPRGAAGLLPSACLYEDKTWDIWNDNFREISWANHYLTLASHAVGKGYSGCASRELCFSFQCNTFAFYTFVLCFWLQPQEKCFGMWIIHSLIGLLRYGCSGYDWDIRAPVYLNDFGDPLTFLKNF